MIILKNRSEVKVTVTQKWYATLGHPKKHPQTNFGIPTSKNIEVMPIQETRSEVKVTVTVKDKDYCPIEIIKGLTDKGQFQYLSKLMGPQEGTYLYATQFHSLR